jgi:hypothetical protein
VAHSLDLDPERVQRVVRRSLAETFHRRHEAVQLPPSELVERALRRSVRGHCGLTQPLERPLVAVTVERFDEGAL